MRTTTLDTAYWNGEPALARRVQVRVPQHDPERHPVQAWWAGIDPPEHLVRALVAWGGHPSPTVDLQGQVVPAVEVEYRGQRHLLYDADGSATWKVTHGFGSPRVGHRDLPLDSEEVVS